MVTPVPWVTWKTDALLKDGGFMWLDNSQAAAEIEWPRERGWLSRWLHVDVCEELEGLLRAEKILPIRWCATQRESASLGRRGSGA